MKRYETLTKDLKRKMDSVLEQFYPVDLSDSLFYKTYNEKINLIPVTFINRPRLMVGK